MLIDLIKKELFKDTKRVVVDTDNIKEKPDYPFYSIKAINLLQSSGEYGNVSYEFTTSNDKRFKYDYLNTLEIQPNMVLSVNAYDKDPFDSMDVAYDAYNFFRFSGRLRLADNNFIVVDVSDVSNRTALNVDNYEYRFGFDVKIRYVHDIEARIETIESYKIRKGEVK